MNNHIFIIISAFSSLLLLSFAISAFSQKDKIRHRYIKAVFIFNKITALLGIVYAIYLMVTVAENFLIAVISWTLLSTSSHLLSESLKKDKPSGS